MSRPLKAADMRAGREVEAPCPVCAQPSYYVRAADRFFHQDGSNSQVCWRRGGDTGPDTETAILALQFADPLRIMPASALKRAIDVRRRRET